MNTTVRHLQPDSLLCEVSTRMHLKALSMFAAALVSACGGSEGVPPPREGVAGGAVDAGGIDGGVDGGGIDDGGVGEAAGGGMDGSVGGGPPAQQLDETVMRLYQTAWFHASQASPFQSHPWGEPESTWTTGTCNVWGQVQASLDGAPAPAVLPTGSHAFEVTFTDDCMVGDVMAGQGLSGTISATYVTSDWNELTAVVSAHSMWSVCCSGGYDFTANGGGTWTRSRTTRTMTYAPAIGATLTNNRTMHVATFGGGSYSSGYTPSPYSEWLQSGQRDFDHLAVAIDGTPYVLHGSIEVEPIFGGTGHGEVRITSDGTLVARIYGDAWGILRTEVLTPLAPF
jgi:hypothetical protein